MFPSERFPLTPSLWAATAVAPPQAESLNDAVSADVAIIGAGYAGLSTALHLAQRGIKVIVLEAREIGFGASGRNGGQVVPGLKLDPDEIVQLYGREHSEKLLDFSVGTADTVFDMIDRHSMQVPYTRSGWIQPAHNTKALETVRRRAEQWERLGVSVSCLDRAQTAALIGSDTYLGGWINRRGGCVQPLSYTRELARAAIAAGASIYTDSPVESLSFDRSNWTLRIGQGGSVKAARVVVCANAYSDGLYKGLKESIIDANTFQVATEPLPDSLAASIFPEGHVASDTRNLLLYFRKDHTGRFLMGGRGPFREPRSAADWAHLKTAIAKLFPQLAGVQYQYHWCGRVAVTRDYMPHLHTPAPGLLINIGCQGRGIGLQTSMGIAMAEYLATGDEQALPLPVTRVKPLPLYALRRLYVSALISWYRFCDERA
ncbi:NAD(P)/FAD-dependent oxidoreductase [Paracandidimonas lactea]|uniref:NAD(P)/FAD-dependent oxidoreductase n=1 Tax=Paracandidimonas lactea TaxID=2895524 RepID=UPI001F47A23D|nr:FAD-binding oxidoreductase [Paracandidimonas lactea]